MSVAAGLPGPWLVSDRSRAALRSLEVTLEQAVAARDIEFAVLTRHLVRAGGKRLRPALVFLAGEFGTFPRARLLKAATALELVHVASLYHDDIIDRASSRRGRPTANTRWGNEPADLAGNYVFARACGLFAQLGDEANRVASAAISEVCTGELAEVENAFDLTLEPARRLEILAAKTASLFRLPCALGALLADAPSQLTDALVSFGNHLGLAFQLADDALDMAGDPAVLGKPAGADLRQGVYGLAVVHAIRQKGPRRDELVGILAREDPTDQEIATARAAVVELGGVDEVLGAAHAEQAEARASLEALPDGPARRSLANLIAAAVERAT